MAGSPDLVVAVKANLDGLQAGMQQVEKTVQQTSGAVTATAQQSSAAMQSMGTTATQTAQQVEQLGHATAALDESNEKAKSKVDQFKESVGEFDSVLGTVGINVNKQSKAIEEIASASSKSIGELGALSTAGLAVGTAMAAWDITRRVMEFFDLDKAVASAWRSLLNYNDAAVETAGAKQDVINNAIRLGADAHIAYAEAVVYVNKKFEEGKQQAENYKTGINALTHVGQEYRDVLKNMTAATVDQAMHFLELGASQKDVQGAFKLTNDQIAAVVHWTDKKKESDAAAKQAAKEFADAMTELNSVGQGWRGTLATIDGATVEAIKYYLDAGVAQNQLATAYSLTAAQVRAVAEARKEELALLAEEEKVHDMVIKHAAQVNKELVEQQKKRTQEVNAAITAELNAQAKLNASYGLAVDGTVKVTSAYDTYIQKLDELHRSKVAGIAQTQQEQVLLDEYTTALYNEAKAHDAVTASVDGTTAAQKQLTSAVSETNETRSQGYLGATGTLGDLSNVNESNTDPMVLMWLRMGKSINEALALASGYGGYTGIRQNVRAFAGGGDVGAGEPALVGERGPELFVPNVPGTVVPNSGGGTTIVQHITITQPLGSARAIADAVGTATLSMLQNRGERFRPAGV